MWTPNVRSIRCILEDVDIVKGSDSNVDGMFAIDGREDWSEMDLNALTRRIRVNIALRKNLSVCESVRSIGRFWTVNLLERALNRQNTYRVLLIDRIVSNVR